MGIFTYLKIGGAVIIFLVAGYFVWNYNHLKKVNAAQKIQIEQQQAAIQYYEKSADVDKTTAEVKDEINKAVDSGDIDRVRDLYLKLRDHQRTDKGKATPKANNGGNDESGD